MNRVDDHPPAGNRKPAILIVEDECLIRMALCDHLKDCGFLPMEAENAAEAIEIIETGVEIDVVFTDVKMPGAMDGFGLAKWIRENRPHLAVFVASGFTGKTDLARELCGGEPFFVKPYDLDVITSRINAHIAARRGARN